MNVGIVGCGNISQAYFKNLVKHAVAPAVACADIDFSRAEAKAAEWGIKALPVDAIFTDPSIDVILNLTLPATHAEINLKALKAGKHAYCEKPFATNLADGAAVLAEAEKRGLAVGCAPDTVLGAGTQTCRRVLEGGAIGKPLSATAFMAGAGHESWHPSPEFYYLNGGGPLYDMGPYYLHSLIQILGPVRSVFCMADADRKTRTITSQPKKGTAMKVEVFTHYSINLQFVSGAIGTMIMSFDVHHHKLPRIEIYGSAGSLSVPDPNTFGGPAQIAKEEYGSWADLKLGRTHLENGRGLGVIDLVKAVAEKRPLRASGHLAQHALEIMVASDESAASGKLVEIKSRPERPAIMPDGEKWY